jgi:hypothetical protein
MKRQLIQHATSLKAVDVNEYSGTTAKAGEVIDFKGYQSAILSVNYAAASGSPTAATLTVTMAEGATSSPATAVTFNTTPAAIDVTSAGITEYHIDLRPFLRYGKFTITPAFTAGTSPACLASATIVLGDKNVEPVPSAVTIYKKA